MQPPRTHPVAISRDSDAKKYMTPLSAGREAMQPRLRSASAVQDPVIVRTAVTPPARQQALGQHAPPAAAAHDRLRHADSPRGGWRGWSQRPRRRSWCSGSIRDRRCRSDRGPRTGRASGRRWRYAFQQQEFSLTCVQVLQHGRRCSAVRCFTGVPCVLEPCTPSTINVFTYCEWFL